MQYLIILSGPSGVGKSTLADKVIEEFPNIQYFKKVTTRTRREDDRDEEVGFLTNLEYDDHLKKCKIALPYEVRGYRSGIPLESLGKLKENTHVYAVGNFDLIRSLKQAFYTTCVYISADQEAIKDRIIRRKDTKEQKKKSIESVSLHLEDYEKNKDLFDYTIVNDDLYEAADKLLDIVEAETDLKKFDYYFVIPRLGCKKKEYLDYFSEMKKMNKPFISGNLARVQLIDNKRLRKNVDSFFDRSFKMYKYSTIRYNVRIDWILDTDYKNIIFNPVLCLAGNQRGINKLKKMISKRDFLYEQCEIIMEKFKLGKLDVVMDINQLY